MAAPARVLVTPLGRTASAGPADLFSVLSPVERDRIKSESNSWIKALRLTPYGRQTMRERFTYKADSLWWFTELYLHKTRRLERAAACVTALERLRREHDPTRLVITGADDLVRTASEAFGAAYRLPVEIQGSKPTRHDPSWASFWIGASARLSPSRRHTPVRAGRTDVAAFVHTAFWRGTDDAAAEAYVGPILEALRSVLPEGGLRYVGLGPTRNFRARRWWDPVLGRPRAQQLVTPIEQLASADALSGSAGLWRQRRRLAREIVEGDGVRQAAIFHGCDLWTVLETELRDAALLQWPWSARAMDEAGSALDVLAPSVVVTYAEAGGWGRALILEARRRGVPTVGIQHGFIYRHWLNYLHEADELSSDEGDRGFPAPERTLVFDRYAAEHLETAGHFPADAITITGSATRDALAADIGACQTAGVEPIRAALGIQPGEAVLVLAAKHAEIAPHLSDIAAAVAATPEVRLVVKVHPAETRAVYGSFVAETPQIVVAPASESLARLLATADALVTMNSTVAIDCLPLGIPAVVVGLPNNLSPFVEAGAMADGSGDLAAVLRLVLYDRESRARLMRRAAEFVARYDLRATGESARGAAREIVTFIS